MPTVFFLHQSTPVTLFSQILVEACYMYADVFELLFTIYDYTQLIVHQDDFLINIIL